MPYAVNGCGTWYYGKRNVKTYQGVCHSCHHLTTLTSYDTRLFVVVFLIPIIPLGRRRIIEQCAVCSRHLAMPMGDWQAAHERAEQTSAKYAAAPMNADLARQALEASVSFRDLDVFINLAQKIEQHLPQHVESLKLLLSGHRVFGRHDDALRLARQVLALEDTPEHREMVAVHLLESRQPDEAAPLLQHIVDQGIPDRVDLLYQLAQTYQMKGQHDQATDAFIHCEMVNPAIAKDATFIRLRDESAKRMGSTTAVDPGKLIERQKNAAQMRTLGRWAAVAAVVAVLAYLAIGIYQGGHRRVYLVSGLQQPYKATINGASYQLTPGKVTPIRVPEGEVTVAFEYAGVVHPQQRVTIKTPLWSRPLANHCFVINPDGTAALQQTTFFYAAKDAPAPDAQWLIGDYFYHLRGIDHPFEEPPQSIQLSGHGSVAKRVVLSLPPALSGYRPDVLLIHLGHKLGARQVAEVVKRRIMLDPDEPRYLALLLMHAGAAEAADFLRPLLAQRPVHVQRHRIYQHAMIKAKREQEMIDEYETMLRSEADNPALMYLLARVVPDIDRAVSLCRQAIQQPQPPFWPYFMLGNYYQRLGQLQEAQGMVEQAVANGTISDEIYELRLRILQGQRDYASILTLLQPREQLPFPDNLVTIGRQALTYQLMGEREKVDERVLRYAQLISPHSDQTMEQNTYPLRVLLSYTPATLEQFLELASSSEDQEHQLMAALTRGDLDRAGEVIEKLPEAEIEQRLLVYLLAHLRQNEAVAQQQLDLVLAQLREMSWEERSLADALAGKPDRPLPQLLQFPYSGLNKAVLLLALATRQPQIRQPCLELAQALNVEPGFPQLLLDAWLTRDFSNPATP